MEFGEKLQKLRKESGLSQEELAGKLNVSRQAVSKWETGATPDMDNVVKLSIYFDCSLDYLLNNTITDEKIRKEGNAEKVCKNDSKDISYNVLKEKKLLAVFWIDVVAVGILLILWLLSEFTETGVFIKDNVTGRMLNQFQVYIEIYNLHAMKNFCVLMLLVGGIVLAISVLKNLMRKLRNFK